MGRDRVEALRLPEVDFDNYAMPTEERQRILPVWALRDVLKDDATQPRPGVLLPWSSTHSWVKLRRSEVSVWSGISGHGKSLLLGQVMLDAIRQGETVCIASLEMPLVRTVHRMIRQAAGLNQPADSYIDTFVDWASGKLWLYDQLGAVEPKRILGVSRFVASGNTHIGELLRVQHMVIDSLMMCGVPSAGDSAYNMQRWFMAQLCSIARDTGCHVHLVAHHRKTDSEKREQDKFDIAGSADITNMADNVFTVWRNKAKEEDARRPSPNEEIQSHPDAVLHVKKQRHGEREGAIGLWHHPDSLQFTTDQNKQIPYNDIAAYTPGADG